ncbi:TIGR00341 family protein [Qipengyuania soli]|uniref:TIGR00341 family protein n=1 Tax=Qipengyuania soli TaxID=2782568 RepID=A0A7S8F4A5_9SPHN|nr:TIGR00341 family protein [Qipengyuania soli]QPC98891.1 TIGR00341 family protein [Qipengyuania soli]
MTDVAAAAGNDSPKRGPISKYTILRAFAEMRAWWQEEVVGQTNHAETIARVRDESLLTTRYVFMIAMSAGIAILGLLLSSPAVVIGAMLLSPLMNPIIGTGFALATGDAQWLRRCARALAVGCGLAVLFCALIVVSSPLQTVTSEIAARTRPNLFDLLVALFSALAGGYAVIRGREGTIVGVAIATALMPPLAVVGFGLATMNWTVFFGALGLFVTNFVTIALTAAVMARFYGYRSGLSERQSRVQSLAIVAVFIALAIPLGFSLRTIAWEANGQRVVNQEVKAAFGAKARVDQPVVSWDTDPVNVTASVFTPEFRTNANTEIAKRLEERLGTPVAVNIDQYRVGTDPGAAEQAALAQARAKEQAEANERQISGLGDRMALVAGIGRDEVMIDRENRRVMATARQLPGLTLGGYRELERRVSSDVPGWTVLLRPPSLTLPSITFEDGTPDEDGAKALALIAWAARRTGNTVVLSGADRDANPIGEQLAKSGVSVRVETGRGPEVRASWAIQ